MTAGLEVDSDWCLEGEIGRCLECQVELEVEM